MDRNTFYSKNRYVLLLDIITVSLLGFLFLTVGMTVKAYNLNLALAVTFSAVIVWLSLKRKALIKDALTNKLILLKVCLKKAEFTITASEMCVPFQDADVQIIRELFLLDGQYQSGCIEQESCYSDSGWNNTYLHTSVKIIINGADFSADELTERDIHRMLTLMDNLSKNYGVNVAKMNYTYDYRYQ